MDLELEFTYDAKLAPALVPGAGPYGTRMVMTVVGGQAKGERISGTLTGAGADWAVIGPDGWARLDVRAQIQTDDGAVIYVSYPGLLQLTEKVMEAVQSGTSGTDFEDQYFRTTHHLETGDERYAWVNQTLFVGRGRMIPGGVEYQVYRVT